MLKAMGIEDDKIDQIIEAHSETIDGLKAEAEKNADAAKKLGTVQKELDDAKKDLEEMKKDSFKDKYDNVKKEFDDYKKEIAGKETQAKKEKAYRIILKDGNLSEKGIEKAVKYAEWEKMELDEKDNLKNASDLVKAAREEWSEYAITTETRGANPANPPTGKGSGTVKTKEEIYKMENGRYVLSASERQAELEKIYKAEKGE